MWVKNERLVMKFIGKYFFCSIFLCCLIVEVSAEIFKLNVNNSYIQISKEKEVTFTPNKELATNFTIEDKFFPKLIISTMSFNIVYNDQDTPNAKLFLVFGSDDNRLKLISEQEYKINQYFWQLIAKRSRCRCYRKVGHSLVTTPSECTLSLED